MTTIKQIKALQTLIDQYEPVVRAAVAYVEMGKCTDYDMGYQKDYAALMLGLDEAVEALPPDTKALLMGEMAE